ncbi:MAG: DsbA family protein [Rhodospirillaceae bacterium]
MSRTALVAITIIILVIAIAPPAAAHAAELIAANPSGASTVVAVINYENVAGKTLHDRLLSFGRANPNVKIVVKPVAGIGPLSEFLAKAAYAAARQGKFRAFHEVAISAPQAHTYYSLRDNAPLIGLDWERFQKDFQNPAIADEVRANATFAAEHKIANPPAFVTGGQVFAGPWEKLNFAKVAAAAK